MSSKTTSTLFFGASKALKVPTYTCSCLSIKLGTRVPKTSIPLQTYETKWNDQMFREIMNTSQVVRVDAFLTFFKFAFVGSFKLLFMPVFLRDFHLEAESLSDLEG